MEISWGWGWGVKRMVPHGEKNDTPCINFKQLFRNMYFSVKQQPYLQFRYWLNYWHILINIGTAAESAGANPITCFIP